MASKEYYDIAYGLRDLAKELNRSDVINTIDSEIKKMIVIIYFIDFL